MWGPLRIAHVLVVLSHPLDKLPASRGHCRFLDALRGITEGMRLGDEVLRDNNSKASILRYCSVSSPTANKQCPFDNIISNYAFPSSLIRYLQVLPLILSSGDPLPDLQRASHQPSS